MERLETLEELEAAVGRLVAVEPRFSQVVERHGLPALRHAEPGLEALLRIVTDQLISLAAGEAIWQRLKARFGDFVPDEMMGASEAELRGLGLSGPKARTFRAAARAFAEGRFAAAEILPATELERHLTAIPGVGPWTASIYLLMAYRAADAWPAADLALQVAAADLLALGNRPTVRQMAAIAAPWRPQRAAAALLLWRHYRALRGMAAG